MKFTKESLAMTGFFLGILFPVRYGTTVLLGDHWLGSFGVLSAISILLTVLAYKKKLGWFGTAFINFFINRTKGKRKFVTIIFLFFTMGTSIMMIYSVHHAHDIMSREQMMSMLPEGVDELEDMDKIIKETTPLQIIVGFLMIPVVMVLNFEAFTLVIAMVNELSNGIYLNLATVILVEELEFICLMVFYRMKFRSL